MKEQQFPRQAVQDFMVKTPVVLGTWQLVAHARQLMLTHSFSFLPVFIGTWKLLSETGLARYMRSNKDWAGLISQSVEQAVPALNLLDAKVVLLEDDVGRLLPEDDKETRLWLVVYERRAQGKIDAVAFGRPFIANPDLIERLRRGIELAVAPHESYYGGGAKGYTDWPKAAY